MISKSEDLPIWFQIASQVTKHLGFNEYYFVSIPITGSSGKEYAYNIDVPACRYFFNVFADYPICDCSYISKNNTSVDVATLGNIVHPWSQLNYER